MTRLTAVRLTVIVGSLVTGMAGLSLIIAPRNVFDIISGGSAVASLAVLLILVFTASVTENGVSFSIPASALRGVVIAGVCLAVVSFGAAAWRDITYAATPVQLVSRMVLTGLMMVTAVWVGKRIGQRIRELPDTVDPDDS